MLRVLASLTALALATSGCVGSENPWSGDVKHVPETKDRLPAERMEKLVAGPMAVVREKGLVEGQAAFERLLAETRARTRPNSVQAADLLTAFAIQLYVENPDPGSTEFEAARAYLKAAIGAYAAAFGPDHAEVALAINSLADLEQKLSPDDPPPAVDSMLQQALRIRTRALGPDNPETVANLVQLGNLAALPQRLKRNPAGLAAADAYYRRAIAGALPGPEGDERSNKAAIGLHLAELHARSGSSAVALAEARKALALSEAWEPRWRRCQLVETRLGEFVELMAARGAGAEAAAIQPQGRSSACSGMGNPSPWPPLRAALRRLFGLDPA